jgi:hypothetical protein
MPEQRARLASPWPAFALVVLVAAILRYPALDLVPPGLNFDEGGEGVAALDVTHGIYRIWWPIGGGKEPLMAYLVQPLFWLFGPTRLALRLYTATMGVLAVAGTVWLAWEMLMPGSRDRGKPPPTGRLTDLAVPLVAGLGLATAFWHVAYSRIAFRALAMPAVEALAVAWLWHALRRTPAGGSRWRDSHWLHFAGAGACIGLGAYTYLAGRFVPLAIVFYLVVEAALAGIGHQRPLVIRQWRGLVVAGLAALLTFAPLGVYFATHPAAFLERASAVSIFSPTWNQGYLVATLLSTFGITLGTFAGLTGDPNPLGNIPGQPMLPLPLAVCFWAGVVACVWQVINALRRRQWDADSSGDPGSPRSALFLLCWWPVMLLPGVLAPEGAPHHLRLIGTAPATYTLVALGAVQLAALAWRAGSYLFPRLKQRLTWSPSRLVALLLPLIVFAPVGLLTAQDYFGRWTQQPDLSMAFDVYAVELAQTIASDAEPGVTYIIPMDLRAAHEARHYTLDFMYHGTTPYFYLPVDDRTVAEQLTRAADGAHLLRVVRWTQDKHLAADEREVVTYLLGMTARLVGETAQPVYRIETWQLPSAHTAFRLPLPDRPLDVVFGGQIRLAAAHLEVARDQVGIALRWLPMAPMTVDYKASVRLVDQSGRLVAQRDRTLRHNWHQGTRLWPPDESVNEYYLLAPVAPGEHQVRVVVYDPDTLAPLIADNRAEVTVGEVMVSGTPGGQDRGTD